jgi:D-threonate/D-erythronate kinase
VRAATQGGERRRLIVAPAFPSAGRTTRGGVQCVDGRPLADGDVPRRLADGGCGEAVVLPRDELVDPELVAATLRAHACVVADAQDDADLVALARGVPDPTAVLWAGSAGLAAALGEVHAGPHPPAAPARPGEGPVLVVIGSGHPVAREQVRRLAAAAAVDVPLDLDDLAATARRAAEALAASRSVVVHAMDCSGGDAVSARIPGSLARVAAALAEDAQSLVLSGGETAVHVARALGVRGLALEHELEPGVPVSRLIGPRPLRVVTKAGGFGGPLTLVRAVEALGGRVGASL